MVVSGEFDRSSGVGGSDVAAILGLSPYRDRTDVWLEKTRHPAWRPKSTSPEMLWGTLLEPVLRERYEAETGRRVYAPGDKTYWDPEHVRYAHLDGLVEEEGVWEGKVPFNTWREWIDGPPAHVHAQVQHYLDLTGEPWCDVSALLLGRGVDLETFRIAADPVAQAHVREAVFRFWNDHVLPKEPPDRLPPAVEYPANRGDLLVVASDEDEELVNKLWAAKQTGRATAGLEEEVKEELQRRIGEAAGMVGHGWRIRWKKNRDSEKTDWKLVAGVWRKQLEEATSLVGRAVDALTAPGPGKGTTAKRAAEAVLHLDAAHRLLTDEPSPATVVGLYTQTTTGARPFVLEETKED